VSLRETITSEIFYEHNYIGAGSMGIIRESMLGRIFGDTPFESATVADIILPRHRLRSWDEKKKLIFARSLRRYLLSIGHTIHSHLK
jgi:hypothetical protein